MTALAKPLHGSTPETPCFFHTGACAASNLSAIVGPVKQCLALPLAAGEVALLTMPSDLCDVPLDLLPASDLPRVFFRNAAPHIVAAVPLEPAARIIGM